MKGFIAAVGLAIMLAAGGLVYLLFFQADTHAPAIVVTDREKVYTQGMNEADLLTGVAAIDDRSGDVTETLSVGEVVPGDRAGTVKVTYQAQDRQKNVGTLVYTYRMASDAPAGQDETWTGEEEGDAGEEPAAMAEEPAGEMPPSEEAEALNESARAEQEARIQELSPVSPRIYLSRYYTEVLHGTEFNALTYVSEIEDDVDARDLLFTRIQINGMESLNMDVPGSYTLTYFVMDSEGHQSNLADMTVRVY